MDHLTPGKVAFRTFGCRTNTFDSDAMVANLEANGWILDSEYQQADVVVVNTCTVTQFARKECELFIRKMEALGKRVIATGCAVEDPDFLPSKASVLKMAKRGSIHEFLSGTASSLLPDSELLDFSLIQSRKRPHIKIQEGCDRSCSYCIIPSTRGAGRSFDFSLLLRQAKLLEQNGVAEIVLTGTHMGAYRWPQDGVNLKLHDLIAQILENTSQIFIRVGSLHPHEWTMEMVELWKHPRMRPYVHLSLQHTETDVLKAMARGYARKHVEEFFERMNTYLPQVYIGMDYVVGYPTETDENHERSFELLSQVDFAKIHAFPYSPRPGTRGAQLKPLVDRIVTDRAKRLRQLSNQKEEMFIQKHLLGKTRDVVWESEHLASTPELIKVHGEKSLGKTITITRDDSGKLMAQASVGLGQMVGV